MEARRPANVVRAVMTGSSPTPSTSSAGSMKKPKPSDTISTGMPAACARRTNGTNVGSCGCAAAVASRSADGTSTSDISSSINRRDPIRPRVIGRHLGFPDPGDVLGHDRVGDIGQRDGPVVVDEDGQRRLPWEERQDRWRRPVLARHRASPLNARAARRPGNEPRRRRATPARMMAPPTTWIGRIGSDEEDRGHDDRERRDEELERAHPCRAEELDGVEDDHVPEAGRKRPGIEDRKDDDRGDGGEVHGGQLGDPDRRDEQRPGKDGPRRGHQRRVPAQDLRAEDRVDRPAGGRQQSQQVADERGTEHEALAGGDDEGDARERTRTRR